MTNHRSFRKTEGLRLGVSVRVVDAAAAASAPCGVSACTGLEPCY
jgi:hypothetical protein